MATLSYPRSSTNTVSSAVFRRSGSLRSWSIVTLMLIVLLSSMLVEGAPPRCRDIPVPANVSDATCEHGVVIDWCNRPVCGKGPREACGGRWNEFGQCGRGMFCGCDVCQGCNRNMQCFHKNKC